MKSKSNIAQLVRPNILALQPYTSARELYSEQVGVFLDANENPNGLVNRYPDPYQTKLKQVLAQRNNWDVQGLFLGNGSDEAIDLAMRIFCTVGKDKILIFTPTYGMYKVYAQINNLQVVEQELNADFQIDLDATQKLLQDEQIKMIFICSPNNPTANSLDPKVILALLQSFDGMVILDQAYVQYCDQSATILDPKVYPNLIVLQTLSKAYGMAGLRIGMAYMHNEVLGYFNKIKSPYNISVLNQQKALALLEDPDFLAQSVTQNIQQRQLLIQELQGLAIVQKIYPSDTNFVLVVFEKAQALFEMLIEKRIIVRNQQHVIPGALRISVGTAQQNTLLIESIKAFNYA